MLHRGDHRFLLRLPAGLCGLQGGHHSAVQRDRHLRQLLVAAFGMRVNTFANSRTAFAALKGKAFPCYDIPLQAGMSIGMLLVSVELLIMLFILLFIPGDLAGACFIGFAIGESLGAAALRVAGGIFTKIADIGSAT
jgi:K(+)-stimulated pyrophosphate-energized sodium pump